MRGVRPADLNENSVVSLLYFRVILATLAANSDAHMLRARRRRTTRGGHIPPLFFYFFRARISFSICFANLASVFKSSLAALRP